jgi:hypothetical protein
VIGDLDARCIEITLESGAGCKGETIAGSNRAVDRPFASDLPTFDLAFYDRPRTELEHTGTTQAAHDATLDPGMPDDGDLSLEETARRHQSDRRPRRSCRRVRTRSRSRHPPLVGPSDRHVGLR